MTQVVLGGLFHLAQDFSRHLRRRQFFVACTDPGVAVLGLEDLKGHQVDVLLDFLVGELAANQPLDGVEGVLGVGHRLTLGGCTDQNLALVHVGDDRWRGARAFTVLDDFGLTGFHDGHAGVGGAQVNANNLCHGVGS